MPRITKKQKEAGVQPKYKPTGKSGQPQKKGFQVGPSRAGKDAYLGKAKKIKADLIHRAKVKQQYAKMLKAEGLESSRLGDGSRRRGERDADGADAKGKDKGKGRSTVEEDGGEDEEEEGEKKVKIPKVVEAPTASGRKRALSPIEIDKSTESKTEPTSLRTLKKEAFSKYHPSAKPTAGTYTRKGQPNMGARMGVLLEKIKRDRN